MKAILLLIVGLSAFLSLQSQDKKNDTKLLRHVVLFKFKDNAAPTDVKKVEQAFAQLPSQIKEIAGFEWGLNNSFKSEDDRAAYLPHPAHKAFVDVLKPHLDKVLVIDYWANK
jgi:hypothetical protein